jgi:hypothetical protein
MGKSSCAIALADELDPIEPLDLERHLSIDLGDLPTKLRNKRRRQTVIQDELPAGAGEGSRTQENLAQNIEDTLRASGINLFWIKPSYQGRTTTQCALELILWNPTQKASLFVMWVDSQAVGVVARSWARKELWDVYKPWKEANVERTKAGIFRDNSYLARTASRAFRDPRLIDFLHKAPNKPKRADIEAALSMFYAQMMAATQKDSLVHFIHTVLYGWDRIGPHYSEWFGVDPSPGLAQVAERCYKE